MISTKTDKAHTHSLVVCPLYNKQLEVLIKFPRFPVYVLLHGVEHCVAILSLVLVRENDDRQLSVILLFMYISQYL